MSRNRSATSLNIVQITNVGCEHSSLLWFLFGSSDESQGQGQLLIQTVKLAFSVTNNVIRLKPPSSVVSPLEQALTQHGGCCSLGQPGSSASGSSANGTVCLITSTS